MKKYTYVTALLFIIVGYLVPITTEAAFPPEFYEQRRLEREQAKEQVQAEEFDRMHSGASRVLRQGRGKGVLLEPPLAYVVRQDVPLPPLTDTGANTPLILCTLVGAFVGVRTIISRKNTVH